MGEPRDQLVVQTAFPGDLLLSIPLLKQVRVHYPQQSITLLCREGLGDFFLKHRLADEVLEVNKKNPQSLQAILKALRAREWGNVFCPHESYRSAIWVRSLRLRGSSVGFRKWWNFLAFSERVEKPTELPDALRQLSLLRAVAPEFREKWDRDIAGKWSNPKGRDAVDFRSEPEIPEWASMRLFHDRATGNVAFIAPGSVWPTKRWTEQGFAALAQDLRNRGLEVIFAGSPAEKDICERLAGATQTRSIAGQTSFGELIERFRHGRILVSNDSGAMHAAAVAGLPTVAVFGPTVLDFGFRPWQNSAIVVQTDLNCRPCAAHGGRHCPIGTHACMRDLPAARVIAEVQRLLGADA